MLYILFLWKECSKIFPYKWSGIFCSLLYQPSKHSHNDLPKKYLKKTSANFIPRTWNCGNCHKKVTLSEYLINHGAKCNSRYNFLYFTADIVHYDMLLLSLHGSVNLQQIVLKAIYSTIEDCFFIFNNTWNNDSDMSLH